MTDTVAPDAWRGKEGGRMPKVGCGRCDQVQRNPGWNMEGGPLAVVDHRRCRRRGTALLQGNRGHFRLVWSFRCRDVDIERGEEGERESEKKRRRANTNKIDKSAQSPRERGYLRDKAAFTFEGPPSFCSSAKSFRDLTDSID